MDSKTNNNNKQRNQVNKTVGIVLVAACNNVYL